MTTKKMDNKQIFQVRNLKVYYPTITGLAAYFKKQRYIKAVDDISFSIDKGEIFSLVGESGCGKTSTGLAVLNLLREAQGNVLFDGVNILRLKGSEMRHFRQRIQVVFQDPYESLNPRMPVSQLTAEPLKIHGYKITSDKIERALQLANLLPPQHFLKKYPYELSGGERQRVSIAAALILEPEFLLLDEPVSNLDVSVKAEILNLFLDLREEIGLTYLFITHDLADTFYLSDKIAVMYLGKIVEMGSKNAIREGAMHPYTKALLSVIPTPDFNPQRERTILKGSVPDPIDLPTGCSFNPRCPHKMSGVCERQSPELVNIGEDHMVACHLFTKT